MCEMLPLLVQRIVNAITEYPGVYWGNENWTTNHSFGPVDLNNYDMNMIGDGVPQDLQKEILYLCLKIITEILQKYQEPTCYE